MRNGAAWEDWCDGFWTVNNRYPNWDELVEAIQLDAQGKPVEPWDDTLPGEQRRQDRGAAILSPCADRCGFSTCELLAGHKGRHQDGGHLWNSVQESSKAEQSTLKLGKS